ncbi:uncharacterized protein B0I36DRAFT_160677 [Microdochium trichocladiopsis]|uniref:RNA polymerase II degradation factor 1 n=1 Tax=Microdochium trichocladiopsis TaxID=1682393 RepID=A0A9P8Y3P9_9PEZI|nr:uncharacterized protein B0I36DRAFT_160677 [Microdochium trichocladiopsis]KAH7026617.1 hypothetical protein B0I36DRAFT_160677 [Microdochium trichocladiopsis]
MSTEVARSSASSSRGRGGGRGGRGGFGGRSANPRRPNGEKSADAFDDDDDVSQLRKQYGSKLDTIKELFPDWSDADILYALQETDGDIELAATRISEGSISQWGEVSKPKKSSAKAKDSAAHATANDNSGSRPARGGRVDSGRGGRGRGAGAERARGAGRGRAGSQAVTANGHQPKEQLSVPTDEAWDTAATSAAESTGTDSWANAAAGASAAPKAATSTASTATKQTKAPAANVAPEVAAPKPAAPAVKTWASMLRQPTAPKPAPKPKETPAAPQPTEPTTTLPPTEAPAPEPVAEPTAEPEPVPEQAEVAEEPKVVEPEVALPPPEDTLTKVNLELLPDESKPLATATVASTTADSWDPRQQAQTSAVATPLSASQAQHQAARPAASGFAASALKATDRPAQRMPSYQRRLLEQEEAVRMPGNREVDRTAVQFGAFNIGESEEDIDGDREEPETRTQPPQESPSAPRAALPPVAQPTPGADSFASAQKAPGVAVATPITAPTGPVGSASQTPQAPGASQQFRQQFQQTTAQEPAGFQQKPYDSFAQQNPVTTSAGFDSFPAATTQAPGPQGAFGSAPGDYSSYYNAEQSGRNAYNNYYAQHYGQQGGSQHEGHGSHRGFGAYGASQADNISQYPQSGTQPSRFGAAAASSDSQNSGHNTPNPTTQSQHQSGSQNSQPQSNIHQQPHGNHYGQHPYYTSPYYAQYMNQAYGGYGQGYGGAPYSKGGGYGQPHQYGMSPQGPYDHSSSPATSGFGGQSSVSGRDSGLGSSVDNYGRGGSSQAGGQGGFGGSSFGGSHDTFGRGAGYPQSGQGFAAPNAGATGAASGADDLKPYGVESKAGAGPSPSLSGAARPGSATNTPGAPGLPPVQSSQQGAGGYGGYPGHGQQSHGLHGGQTGNSAYGLGGSGGQGQGNNPYGGGYGGSQGFGNYYGGRQQHQGGWGGNYH